MPRGAVGPSNVSARQPRSHLCRHDPSPKRAPQVHIQQGVRSVTVFCVGRRSMPPAERPSTGVRAEMGRERPASASHMRPRARPAGSLTPHTWVSVMCWVARFMVGGIASEDATVFTENNGGTRH